MVKQHLFHQRLVSHTEELKQNALKHLYADVESRSQAYAGGYAKPLVANAFGWTGREDAYNTFKNISDQHMRQFLGDQSGDPFGVSKNEAEEQADYIAAEKMLSKAAWQGTEHAIPSDMEILMYYQKVQRMIRKLGIVMPMLIGAKYSKARL